MSARHVGMGLAFVVALYLAVFGDKTPWDGRESLTTPPGPALVRPVPVGVVSQPGAGAPPTPTGASRSSEVLHRAAWFDAHQHPPIADVFAVRGFQAQPVVQPDPPTVPAPVQPTVAGVKPAEFVVVGKQFDGEQWAVYLSDGAGVWVARAGAKVDGRYAVDAIAPPTLALRHLDTGAVWWLDIGAAP